MNNKTELHATQQSNALTNLHFGNPKQFLFLPVMIRTPASSTTF